MWCVWQFYDFYILDNNTVDVEVGNETEHSRQNSLWKLSHYSVVTMASSLVSRSEVVVTSNWGRWNVFILFYIERESNHK
jgi:hypothetical protein